MTDMVTCITVDWSCMPDEEVDALNPVMKERAERFAQMAIRILTAGQVGGCPITVRPCVSSCTSSTLFAPWAGLPWVPFLRDGVWYNGCGCTPTDCSCSTLTTINLAGPVGSVPVVKVDGVTLVSGQDYRVDKQDRLVRLGGPEWPTCQDMTLDDTEVGTMSVEYVQGVTLDTMGEFVAGLLAMEYLNACNNKKCRLPATVTSVVRQGVTMEFGKEIFPGGRTGMQEVDLWVATWNPYKVKMPSMVFSPDVMQPTQTQWV